MAGMSWWFNDAWWLKRARNGGSHAPTWPTNCPPTGKFRVKSETLQRHLNPFEADCIIFPRARAGASIVCLAAGCQREQPRKKE